MNTSFYRCHASSWVEKGSSATIGGVLFSAGLLGNLLALVLLARSGLGSCRPGPLRPTPSVFYVLVCGLTATDLLGKCLISPIVLAAYAQNRSLQKLLPDAGNELCQAFAFIMSFFGLASTLQLLAMALECWLSLGHPFFYQRHITLRRGVLVAPVVGAFCLVFCALPFAGFGNFVQYCPGTWCFIQMVHEKRSLSVLGFSVLYSSLMALLVLATVLCNLGAMHNLYAMHRRLRRHSPCCPRDRAQPGSGHRQATPHPLEELDHLLLLALMTVLFTMCSLPLIYRAYYGAFKLVDTTAGDSEDLQALRFLSVISIVDPWIFIIFRTSILFKEMEKICNCKFSSWLQNTQVRSESHPVATVVLFKTGVLGNLIALALLARRWRGDTGCSAGSRTSISLFHVLVTELVLTDLLGTCLISPVVLASYARKQSLVALAPESRVCTYFAFTMTFFSLATMLMLFAMALERYVSIGHPYFYRRRFSRRGGLAVLPTIYAVSLLFCSPPLLNYGEYVQYCPGTWCFIRHGRTAYLQLYATVLLLLILAVLACNFSVILNLIRMHRRGRRSRCGSSGSGLGGPGSRRRGERTSMAEEADHLILLAIMTITFAICSLPFTIFAYMNETSSRKEKLDLQALRFLSINSIIDPWVFAILRPPVLRLMRSVLCCRTSLRTQEAPQTSCSIQSTASKQTDLCRQL
ncbi:prostaglandin E2 receptor EP2 subtype [Sigmodon hispidus]